MNMSSQENTMDAKENENWVEQHSAAAEVWGAKGMGRKERWEIDKAREASESEPFDLDTTKEAIERGDEIEWGTPTLNSTTNSDPSYPTGHSTTEEHPVMIQQVVGAKEMGETNRKVEDDGPGVPLHSSLSLHSVTSGGGDVQEHVLPGEHHGFRGDLELG